MLRFCTRMTLVHDRVGVEEDVARVSGVLVIMTLTLLSLRFMAFNFKAMDFDII